MKLNKRAYIITNGCPENRIDASRMKSYLQQNGYLFIDRLSEADLIIFNTCALTKDSASASVRTIKRIKLAKKPLAQLIVCGCLSKIDQQLLRTVYSGPAFGSDEIEKLSQLLKLGKITKEVEAHTLVDSAWDADPPLDNFLDRYLIKHIYRLAHLLQNGPMDGMIKWLARYRVKHNHTANIDAPQTFYIKICSGCLNNCAFCAVRFSRGRLNSKALEKIIQEFKQGLKKGYQQFALIGTEVGSYGIDLGIDLVTLLKALVQIEGNYQIWLRNIHPKALNRILPELREFLKTGKISFLSCALQSGNNRILKLMNRGYQVEEFKTAIQSINEEFPHLTLRTQVMVGFPGETEQDFQDTLTVLDQLNFDFVEVYMFQPRPGTKAATMDGQVPAPIIKRRCLKLLLKLMFNRKKSKK